MRSKSAIAVIALCSFGLDACKLSDQSAQVKTDNAQTTSPKYTELERQAGMVFRDLSPTEQAAYWKRIQDIKLSVEKMTQAELQNEFSRLSKLIYSKQGWSNFQTAIANKDSAIRLEANNELTKYAAIRRRADKEFPIMKQDVYNSLFARDAGEMLDIKSEQFMTPTAVSLGSGTLSLVAFCLGGKFFADVQTDKTGLSGPFSILAVVVGVYFFAVSLSASDQMSQAFDNH